MTVVRSSFVLVALLFCLLSEGHGTAAIAPPGKNNDDDCLTALRQSYPIVPENFTTTYLVSRLIPFRSITHAHPDVLNNMFFPLVFHCLVRYELDMLHHGDPSTLNIVHIEKVALEETLSLMDCNATTCHTHDDIELVGQFLVQASKLKEEHARRGIVGDLLQPHLNRLSSQICGSNRLCRLVSGAVSGLASALIGEILNDVLSCANDAISLALGVQSVDRAFRGGEVSRNDIAGVLSSSLSTILSCAKAAARATPLGPIWTFIRRTRAAITCANSIVTVNGKEFDAFEVGYSVTNCAQGLGNRRRADSNSTAVAVPATWTCPREFYFQQDGCDLNCGAFDPDCLDASQPTHTTVFHQNEYPVPDEWVCPDSFYATSDGCDQGCGAPDPDCFTELQRPNSNIDGESSALRFSIQYTNPKAEMIDSANKEYLKAIARGSGGEQPHNLSHAELAGIIVGTVVVTLVCVGALFAIFKQSASAHRNNQLSKKARSTFQHPMEGVSYALMVNESEQ